MSDGALHQKSDFGAFVLKFLSQAAYLIRLLAVSATVLLNSLTMSETPLKEPSVCQPGFETTAGKANQ